MENLGFWRLGTDASIKNVMEWEPYLLILKGNPSSS